MIGWAFYTIYFRAVYLLATSRNKEVSIEKQLPLGCWWGRLLHWALPGRLLARLLALAVAGLACDRLLLLVSCDAWGICVIGDRRIS